MKRVILFSLTCVLLFPLSAQYEVLGPEIARHSRDHSWYSEHNFPDVFITRSDRDEAFLHIRDVDAEWKTVMLLEASALYVDSVRMRGEVAVDPRDGKEYNLLYLEWSVSMKGYRNETLYEQLQVVDLDAGVRVFDNMTYYQTSGLEEHALSDSTAEMLNYVCEFDMEYTFTGGSIEIVGVDILKSTLERLDQNGEVIETGPMADCRSGLESGIYRYQPRKFRFERQ